MHKGKVFLCFFCLPEEVIKRTDPDLVVFTGDNVSGVGVPELLKTFIKKIEALASKYDFLWAPVFGNHDLFQKQN